MKPNAEQQEILDQIPGNWVFGDEVGGNYMNDCMFWFFGPPEEISKYQCAYLTFNGQAKITYYKPSTFEVAGICQQGLSIKEAKKIIKINTKLKCFI